MAVRQLFAHFIERGGQCGDFVFPFYRYLLAQLPLVHAFDCPRQVAQATGQATA
ncbi:hypothetical protein D3C83_255450 [compost metagenome]